MHAIYMRLDRLSNGIVPGPRTGVHSSYAVDIAEGADIPMKGSQRGALTSLSLAQFTATLCCSQRVVSGRRKNP